MKRCPKCNTTKDDESFSRLKTSPDKLDSYCKECRSAYGAAYYRKHKKQRFCVDCNVGVIEWRNRCDSCKERYLFNKNCMRHGITIEEYEAMFERQAGVCAICSSDAKLTIDHDHTHCPGAFGCSECVRGLLCFKCNVGLGSFNDDLDTMQLAMTYVKKIPI